MLFFNKKCMFKLVLFNKLKIIKIELVKQTDNQKVFHFYCMEKLKTK